MEYAFGQEAVDGAVAARRSENDQSGPEHGPAGESAPRRNLPVEQNVDAKEQNAGRQDAADAAGNLVAVGGKVVLLADSVVVLVGRAHILLVAPEQNHDANQRRKEYVRFPEGVEGAVVENHPRDDVHRPGFL